ncbi:hypothetical protein LguiB_029899 [Lonicera macranthoides]
MAAKCAISSSSSSSSSSFITKFPLPTKLLSSPSHSHTTCSSRPKANGFKIFAELGGGEGEVKQSGKKKFITKEQEPDQYWQTAGEREGENPMMTPLPYIIIFGMSTPFVILAIGFFNGWIKVPIR